MWQVDRWGYRDRVVAAAGLLLAWASFGPWFGITWAVGSDGESASSSANAWNSSSAWTTAVVLGVGSALLWTGRERGRAESRWMPLLAAGLVVFALALARELSAEINRK